MFENAKLKSEWAKHHIRELETQFRAFIERNPYRVGAGHNANTGKTAIRLIFHEKLPTSVALIIGDAVHNMRTALDHMTWELIGLDGGTQDRYLKFPTGDNRVNFESSCQGIKTPTQAIRDLLKSLEAFPSGKGDVLYRLHLLDNSDKHTVLTPVIRAAKVSKLLIFNADRTLNTTLINNTFAGDTGPLADIWQVPTGGYVEFDPEVKATPDIFFGPVLGVPARPVFEALSEFSHAVSSAIDIIEKSMAT